LAIFIVAETILTVIFGWQNDTEPTSPLMAKKRIGENSGSDDAP
jgi:hypothetical protein